MRETRWIDPAGPFLRKRTEVGPSDAAAVREERVRLYSAEELEALVASVGLQVADRWGDYAGSPFAPSRSERLLLWARKEVA